MQTKGQELALFTGLPANVDMLISSDAAKNTVIMIVETLNLDRDGVMNLVEIKLTYNTTFYAIKKLVDLGCDLASVRFFLETRNDCETFFGKKSSLIKLHQLYQRFVDMPAIPEYQVTMIEQLMIVTSSGYPDQAIKRIIEFADMWNLSTVQSAMDTFTHCRCNGEASVIGLDTWG